MIEDVEQIIDTALERARAKLEETGEPVILSFEEGGGAFYTHRILPSSNLEWLRERLIPIFRVFARSYEDVPSVGIHPISEPRR